MYTVFIQLTEPLPYKLSGGNVSKSAPSRAWWLLALVMWLGLQKSCLPPSLVPWLPLALSGQGMVMAKNSWTLIRNGSSCCYCFHSLYLKWFPAIFTIRLTILDSSICCIYLIVKICRYCTVQYTLAPMGVRHTTRDKRNFVMSCIQYLFRLHNVLILILYNS